MQVSSPGLYQSGAGLIPAWALCCTSCPDRHSACHYLIKEKMPKIQLKQKARHEMEEENSSSVFISLNSDKNKKKVISSVPRMPEWHFYYCLYLTSSCSDSSFDYLTTSDILVESNKTLKRAVTMIRGGSM